MFNFQLEITGASLCGPKFTVVFFSSEKEALDRIRLEEKPSHFRSSEEEDSSESSISSLVRTAVSKKLLINLIHLFWGRAVLLPLLPSISLISCKGLGKTDSVQPQVLSRNPWSSCLGRVSRLLTGALFCAL